jgi:hypothetical protein
MDNKSSKFRELLAEQGIEMTPDQATDAYKMARKIRKIAKKLSTRELWDLEDNESLGITREERIQIADLYRAAKET